MLSNFVGLSVSLLLVQLVSPQGILRIMKLPIKLVLATLIASTGLFKLFFVLLVVALW